MKNVTSALGIFLAVASPVIAHASVGDLLPQPKFIETTGKQAFCLNRPISIIGERPDSMMTLFVEQAAHASGGKCKSRGYISVSIVDSIPGAYDYKLAGFPAEAYSIDIAGDTICVKSVDAVGVKRAASTLMQLALNSDKIPALEIRDWPAFKLRGFMHDVGRSFISIDEIKKEIDLLARFKVNTFHWHLTENQAWRFAVDEFPALTADTSFTRFPRKYYTPQQARELERYAYERGITIIPEIDMPGHSAAFTRAMGHNMQTDEGISELYTILEATAKAFPLAPYIHIGGDEVAITYPGFLDLMIDKVHSLGKKVVVWNPIHGVDLNKLKGIDMTQMWGSAGRKVVGVPNIDCRYNYTNHFDIFSDNEAIHNSSIYYVPEGNSDVAGTISACWNDRKLPGEMDIIRQNNMIANILASADRAWIGGGDEYIEKAGTVVKPGTERHEQLKDWEERFLTYKDSWLKDEPIPYVRQGNVVWRVAGPFENGGDADASFWPEQTLENQDTPLINDVVGGGIYLRHVWGGVVPALYGNINPGNTAYAWTWVYSPEDIDAGALVEFQNYSRSERDLAPENGQWDRKGSRIWINDKELQAPQWFNSGLTVNNESLLLNENASARPPVPVHLNKGWNKVFIKLPYVKTPGVRLNKWMFTFVLTDKTGRNALDGIVYSTEPDLTTEQ